MAATRRAPALVACGACRTKERKVKAGTVQSFVVYTCSGPCKRTLERECRVCSDEHFQCESCEQEFCGKCGVEILVEHAPSLTGGYDDALVFCEPCVYGHDGKGRGPCKDCGGALSLQTNPDYDLCGDCQLDAENGDGSGAESDDDGDPFGW